MKEIIVINGQDNMENKSGQMLITNGDICWHDLQNILSNHTAVIIIDIIANIIITDK